MTVMHLRYGTFCGEMLLALLLDDHNREFIQEIQRYEHKHKREGVATGSDDCCKYHQTHNGMTPIFAQEWLVEDAELWQQPGQQRHLKHQAHDQDEHGEITYVGRQVNLVLNGRTKIILHQEAEGEGENKQVTQCTTYVEHDGAT